MTHPIRVALAVALAATVTACSNDSPTAPTASVPYSQSDLRVGTGTEATTGRTVTVAYSGWLYVDTTADHKGTRFDAGTISFVLGAGQVIRGWDRGILGMRVGGQRRLVIPPDLAYGASGSGPIPPNATLLFEVELQGVR